MALTDTLEQNALNKIDGKKDRVELVPSGQNVNGKFVANAPKTPAPLPPPTYTPPNTIDASALSSSPTPLQQANPTSSDFEAFQAFLSSATPSDTALTDQRSTLNEQIRGRIRELGQKGARQTELEAEAGIPEEQQALKETNLQIARLKESFDTAIVNEEGVARPQEFITGRQDFLSKKRAVQVDALTAVAEAMQGNITLAQAAAKDAVDREFEDEEADLEALWFDYTANKDELERSDKKAADQLANYLTERARLLTNNKEERAGIIALAQQAALDGAPSDVISQITQAQTREDALALGGQYIGALDRQLKEAQLSNIYDQIFQRSQPSETSIKEAQAAAAKGEQALESAKEVQRLALGLKNFGSGANYGRRLPEWMRPFSALETRDFDATTAQLKAMLTKDTLGALKGLGAMSDREFTTLTAAATKLDTGLSRKAFDEEIDQILKSLAPTLGVLELDQSDLDDIDALTGSAQSTTPSAFSPANYY